MDSLIDLGGLAKPATELIRKVSDAFEGLAKPWQIERVARAESRKQILAAQTQAKILEIERRALIRLAKEEGRKQANMENIVRKAIPNLSADSKPDKLDDDWITYFFDRCKLVSNGEMQLLWAKILAGEAHVPGSYSRNTIDIVSHLDKTDAVLFVHLSTFVWVIDGDLHHILPKSFLRSAWRNFFADCQHLADIGLINFTGIGELSKLGLSKRTEARYHDSLITIEFPNDNNRLPLGMVGFTQSGRQLYSICGAKRCEEYFSHILSTWIESNYSLSTPLSIESI